MEGYGQHHFRGIDFSMTSTNLILLLQLINARADVDSLLRRGLRYSQISLFVTQATKDGLIQHTDGKPVLTKKGYEIMRIDSHSGELRSDGGWISFAEWARKKKLKIDEIFLPDVKELLELKE